MLGHFEAFNTAIYFCITVAWDVFRILVGQLELINKGNLFATWVNLKLLVALLWAQIWAIVRSPAVSVSGPAPYHQYHWLD